MQDTVDQAHGAVPPHPRRYHRGRGGPCPTAGTGEKVHRVERRYGAFLRSITLLSHVMADAIEATAQDGVLRILVPKAPEVRAKRIQVRAGPGKPP